jgi:hypothetical protein
MCDSTGRRRAPDNTSRILTMTTARDLISFLQQCNPDAEILLMTQRKDPYENHIAGVVMRADLSGQDGRHEPGMGHDDVFLVVGKRIRQGNPSAWLHAEQSDQLASATASARAEDEEGWMAASVDAIVKHQLEIPVHSARPPYIWALPLAKLRDALEHAYRAGVRCWHLG